MRLPGSVTASEREFRVHQHHVCSCKGGGSVPARLGDKRATSTPAGTWSVHPCGREEEGDTRHVGFPDQCAQRARGGGRDIHQYLGTGASRPVSVWPAFPSSGVSRANRAFGLTCSRASMGQRTRDRCPKRSQSETVSRGSVSRSGVRGHLRAPDGLSIWWTGSGVAHFRRSSSPGGRSPQRAPGNAGGCTVSCVKFVSQNSSFRPHCALSKRYPMENKTSSFGYSKCKAVKNRGLSPPASRCQFSFPSISLYLS